MGAMDDESSEDDEDYNPDKEKYEDVKEEYESDVSDSTDSDSDWSGGEGGGKNYFLWAWGLFHVHKELLNFWTISRAEG